jgi:FkbM family methyltransferase
MSNLQREADRVYHSPAQRLAHFLHACKARFRAKERARVRWLAAFIPPGGVIVEAGAHFGYLTKEFARIHGGTCRVYGFEPLPYNFSILRRVVGRFANVSVRQQALSDANGTADLFVPVKYQGKIGPGLAHLGAERQRDFVRHTVETVRLDDFVGQAGLARLDFIKADVEGAEGLVLRGGEQALRRFGPAIYVELDARFTARLGYTPQELFAFLAGLGYRASRGGAAAGELEPVDAYQRPGDYLFRRQDDR